ncbi:MAG: M15 family metallopeptidase [Zhenhengia sp.]|uniref:M15 family metallopeptidase n=1 Tax=Zhenhengia sp. TaxID=2944208 RepID=UPI003995B994
MNKKAKKRYRKKIRKYIVGTSLVILSTGMIVTIYSSTLEDKPFNEYKNETEMLDNHKNKDEPINEKQEEGISEEAYRDENTNENADDNADVEPTLYYYEADKEERYLAYAERYPKLPYEEVVWQVNAGVDQPHYTGVTEITDTEEEIILVNKYHKLPLDFEPKELVPLSSGPLVTPATKEAYEQMVRDAKAEGYSIRGVSAYRSIAYQIDVYNRYLRQDPEEVVDTYSARPGFSEHHTGRTIDLDNIYRTMDEFEHTKEAKWVAENAYKYGFIVRYPKNHEDITGYIYEPWHITYVGIPIATEMKEQGIETLEEYWVKYVDHKKAEF